MMLSDLSAFTFMFLELLRFTVPIIFEIEGAECVASSSFFYGLLLLSYSLDICLNLNNIKVLN